MWRDPLDELIDDLERVAPDPSETLGGFPFATIQAIVDAVLYGSPAEVEAYMADPVYQRWAEQRAEWLQSRTAFCGVRSRFARPGRLSGRRSLIRCRR